MLNKIYIRVDGGNKIGLGHLVRCIALALMLKEDFDITFVTLSIPADISEDIILNGFCWNKINSEDEFFEIITPIDLIILDHYGLDSFYQKKIKEIGCNLICIDDLYDKEFYADLIINHTPGIVESDYKAQAYTKFALGIEFALLRPAFLEVAKQDRQIEKMETLFICFGGADFKNLTSIVLNVALEFQSLKKIIIVTGTSFEFKNELKLLINNNYKVDWFSAVSEEKILELMMLSDLAMVPSSGILLETLCTGCKVITGMYIENQSKALKNISSQGNIIITESFSDDDIRNAIFEALNSDVHFAKIIDGKQKDRLVEKVKSIQNFIC
jgi:UDP-2,4-diacetamido-2,4,6-trideoxy-beta-L-altropyranose hydrolase